MKERTVIVGCSVFINKAGGVVRSGASRPLSHFRYGNRRPGAPNLGRRESERRLRSGQGSLADLTSRVDRV